MSAQVDPPNSARRAAELARMAMVARRYYLGGETKQEISTQLGISRFKVARLIDEARAQGVVRIEIDGPLGFDLELAQQLQDKYNLVEVWVVDSLPAQAASADESLGVASGPILAEMISSEDNVGLGWGRTLSVAVDSFPYMAASSVTQLSGGSSSSYGDGPSDLPRMLASRFSVRCHLLETPFVVANTASAKALRSETSIAETLRQFGTLTIAINGIGAWDKASPTVKAIPKSDLDALDEAGIVAHSFPLFFDAEGTPEMGPLQERIIGISAEQFKAIPRRVAIAGGLTKVRAIDATLRSGFQTHLVTDRLAAEALALGHV